MVLFILTIHDLIKNMVLKYKYVLIIPMTHNTLGDGNISFSNLKTNIENNTYKDNDSIELLNESSNPVATFENRPVILDIKEINTNVENEFNVCDLKPFHIEFSTLFKSLIYKTKDPEVNILRKYFDGKLKDEKENFKKQLLETT